MMVPALFHRRTLIALDNVRRTATALAIVVELLRSMSATYVAVIIPPALAVCSQQRVITIATQPFRLATVRTQWSTSIVSAFALPVLTARVNAEERFKKTLAVSVVATTRLARDAATVQRVILTVTQLKEQVRFAHLLRIILIALEIVLLTTIVPGSALAHWSGIRATCVEEPGPVVRWVTVRQVRTDSLTVMGRAKVMQLKTSVKCVEETGAPVGGATFRKPVTTRARPSLVTRRCALTQSRTFWAVTENAFLW